MLPCAILCGGLATRLHPITKELPKSLIPINGEPFIAHQLRLLRSNDINEVTLCVGHLGEMIREVVGGGSAFDLRISYSFDGLPLRGTAGAVRNALPLLGVEFFVLYGDSYLVCDYQSIVKAFQNARAQALMTIYENEGRFDGSNVEACGGRIVRYDKVVRTSRMRHIDYGLGVFNASVFEALAPGEKADLAEIYRELSSNGSLAAYEVRQRFYEIGSVNGIRELEQFLSRESDGIGSDKA